jgi:hypothetical protein
MLDLDRFWDLIEQTRGRIAAASQDESGPTLRDEDALTATFFENQFRAEMFEGIISRCR